jgi:tetratricopeptide (TPR) repeat protein
MLNMKSETAFILTIVFSVHPILSQAVGWIPGRNDVLLALFVFAGMICLIKFLKDFRSRYVLLHFFFLMAALFTKETAVFFPLFGLLYSVFLMRRKALSKEHLILISGYLFVIILWAVLRESALSEQKKNLISLAAHWKNLLYNLPLLLQYISKIFIPYKLSTLSTVKDTNYPLGIIVLFLLFLGMFLSKNKDRNKIAFGSLWFLLFLLPSFVAPKVTGAEHRVYLPLAGLLIVVSEMDFMKSLSLNKKTTVTAIALVSLLLTINIKHTASFKNLLNFWKVAAENTTHSSLAFLNYGAALFEGRRYDAAIQAYKRGIEINPKQRWIHNNLALVYLKKNMYAESEAEFLEELKNHPDYSDVYYNLGLLYKSMGFMKKATRMWERAVMLNPKHQQARDELAGRNTLPGKRRHLSEPM